MVEAATVRKSLFYMLALAVPAFFFVTADSCSSMEFDLKPFENGLAISATGEIERGDANKLKKIADQATIDQRGLRRIILESPGGLVAEATRIAEIIKSNNFMTLVGGECASACASVLYPAGRYAVLLDGGKLGFHSCYDATNLIELPECTQEIAELAARNGMPLGSVKVLSSLAGPTNMYWISNVLAHCYGLEHMVGDPDPVAVENLCPKIYSVLIANNFHEANRPLGPSFDCLRAAAATELLLCRDPELMHLDALLGSLYRMMKSRKFRGHTNFVVSQRHWIEERENKVPSYVRCFARGRIEQKFGKMCF